MSTNAEVRQALLDILGVGQKHDVPAPVTAGTFAHGTGGLFNTPGLDQRVFSAIQMPQNGILNYLPVMPPGTSIDPGADYGGYDTPFYDTITGVTAGNLDAWANQPTTPCGDPPRPGYLKACTLTAPYGRFFGSITPLDMTRVGRLTNRGEPTDLNWVNRPAGLEGTVMSNIMGQGFSGSSWQTELGKRLIEGAVSFSRMIAPFTYTGNPTANTAGARQFNGLDILINANNKLDAFTSAVCTALNSDIKDFNYNLVTGTTPSIVTYVEMVIAYLQWNASQQGLTPVDWVLVMRPELFEELTGVWPIRQYQQIAAQAAAVSANVDVSIDARLEQELRNSMRTGYYLPIRGRNIPVIVDDTIFEDNNVNNQNLPAGRYASDIYVIPMRVNGTLPVTYFEAFNYDNNSISQFMNLFGAGNPAEFFVSDGGRFLWWRKMTNVCVEWSWVVEYRVILRTPQLAGRIQNVAYEPLQHFRSWDTASDYFFDGGRTNTPISSYYGEWGNTPITIG